MALKFFLPLALGLTFVSTSRAEDAAVATPAHLTVTSGKVFEGEIVSITSGHVYLRDQGGLRRVRRDQLTTTDAAMVTALLKQHPSLKEAELIPADLAAQDFRPFASTDGRVIVARILKVGNTSANIQTPEGKEFNLTFDRFADEDRTFLQGQIGQTINRASLSKVSPGDKANAQVEFAELNQAFGQPLLADGLLWDDTPETAAGSRLGWPRESSTELLVSYRLYPQFPNVKPEPVFKKNTTPDPAEKNKPRVASGPARPGYTFLGAKPYSCALYGKGGRVTSLSLVFTNRGDANAAGGSGTDHFKKGEEKTKPQSLDEAIRSDADSILEKLTKVLGAPVNQKVGEGKTAYNVRRWDWRGHAFLLTEEPGSHVALAILPSAEADLQGKPPAVSDDAIQARLKLNVTKRPNGDVYLKNIPMVDQGPKGYCMPATFERVMRYMGMDADMYLIAMMGGTNSDGSEIEPMVKGVRSYLALSGRTRETSRRLRDSQFKFDVENIAKYIDQGIPVLWPHFSTEAFNKAADRRMDERLKCHDWDGWKIRLEGLRKQADQFHTMPTNGHINVIIGYNRETGEYCFTDSWGEDYAERWMQVDEGNYVGAHFNELDKLQKRAEKKGEFDLDKFNWKTPVTVLLLEI